MALQVFILLFLIAKVGFTGLSLWEKKETSAGFPTPNRMTEKTGQKAPIWTGSVGGDHPEIIKAVQDKALALEIKRQSVEEKEKDLGRIQMEIDGKLNQLNQLQVRLKKIIDESKSVQDKKVQHLSEIFCAIPPDKAARMVEKMDDRTVTEVFQFMRSKEVGGILTHLDPARAARISANLSLLAPRAN